jgi:mRNA interferase RelE/StbE
VWPIRSNSRHQRRESFRKLSAAVRASLAPKIDLLARNPRPSGTKKLVGEKNGWRLRVGDYRILYEIRDSDYRVLIVIIGHRRDVYRRR